MKNIINQEKGITGIDIVVAVFIITIFVALITTLFYNINSNSASIERKTRGN